MVCLHVCICSSFLRCLISFLKLVFFFFVPTCFRQGVSMILLLLLFAVCDGAMETPKAVLVIGQPDFRSNSVLSASASSLCTEGHCA